MRLWCAWLVRLCCARASTLEAVVVLVVARWLDEFGDYVVVVVRESVALLLVTRDPGDRLKVVPGADGRGSA